MKTSTTIRTKMLNSRVAASDCDECLRLWDEFKIANHDYFELDDRLNTARYARDNEIVKLVQPLWDESDTKRSALRQEIRAHERSVSCERSSGQ